jgi:hypothetical protein
MSLKQKILVAIMGAGLTLAGAASASATPWQNAHPRRVEVNHRLAHQEMRIHRALREGRITPHQAASLRHEDRMIRHEERRDAAFHGGHVTRQEQARLNRQENGVSGQLHRDAR